MLFPCKFGGGGFKDPTSSGRDLTKVFALEIANFPSPWYWIQDRINNRNYKGINECDFIPMTVDSETHEMQIAGINTYKGTTDQNLDDHIDFISRDCYSKIVQWNTTDNNNGTAAQEHPYLASNVKQFLEQLYNKLPADVKNVIAPKRALLEKRYSASGALTDSISWDWQWLGKLWLPSEYEVFGSIVWGTKGFSAGQALQYPIFANSWKNRVKGAGLNVHRSYWWLLSVRAGNSTNACSVHGEGYSINWPTSYEYRVPICFRIKKS